MAEVDELGLIFNEEQVCGYTIKGWTLRQFQTILPVLLEALGALKEKGISWDDIDNESGHDEILSIAQEAVAVLAPRADIILSTSIGISIEEAGDLDLSTAAILLVKIVAKNIDQLKNLPARITALVKTVNPGSLS